MIILIRTDRYTGVGGQNATGFRSAPFGTFGEQSLKEYQQRLKREAKEGNITHLPVFGAHCETTQEEFYLFGERYSAAAEALGNRRTDYIEPVHISNGKAPETVVADFTKGRK